MDFQKHLIFEKGLKKGKLKFALNVKETYCIDKAIGWTGFSEVGCNMRVKLKLFIFKLLF